MTDNELQYSMTAKRIERWQKFRTAISLMSGGISFAIFTVLVIIILNGNSNLVFVLLLMYVINSFGSDYAQDQITKNIGNMQAYQTELMGKMASDELERLRRERISQLVHKHDKENDDNGNE